MKKIEPKDIDDDLFCYYDETGELPTDWEQVTFFDEETDLAVVSVDGIYGAVNRNGETIIPIIYDILADSQRFRIKDHELIILKKRTLYCCEDCKPKLMIKEGLLNA